ncbi:hypothetical protein AB8613_02935 [Vibrio sp. BS-M-Sm-2]|uniref:hypothetical protein n=1 Tax=Vibrio sp. BS-M-Sm-2 TaxID=3241167 RepID=UPI003555EA41
MTRLEKAKHTAPHVAYNVDFGESKKREIAIAPEEIANRILERDPWARVIKVSNEGAMLDVLDYYSNDKSIKLVVTVSKDSLSDAIQEQKFTYKRDIVCFETGERFSFKAILELNARMFVLTGDSAYSDALAFIIQSIINIKVGKAKLVKILSKLGMAQPVIKDLMSRKNGKLTNTVNDNLFLPKSINILNIVHLSEVTNAAASAMKAQTGYGKNVDYIDPAIRKALGNGEKVSFITSLKTIINKNSKTHEDVCMGFTSYEVGQNIIDVTSPNAFAVCINSLNRKVFLEQVLGSDLVVIDEIESCIRGILLGNDSEKSKRRMSKEERKSIIDALTRVIKSAPKLMVADADISPLTANFLISIRPDIQIYNIEQDYRDVTASVATKAMVMQEAAYSIQEYTDNVVVMFDQIRELNEFLKGLDLNDETALEAGILVLNSATSGRKEQKEFLDDPNSILAQNKYRAILCSPTLGRGFSITHHYTQKVFVIANGVLDPTSTVQFARRFRTATELVFGVSTKHKITVDHVALLKPEASAFDRMIAEYKTEHELLTSNISITLTETLRALKFRMVEHASVNASEEEVKAAEIEAKTNRKKNKDNEIKCILRAGDKTESEIKLLKKKVGRTRQENFEVTRHEYQQKTGIKNITKAEIDFCNSFSIGAFRLLENEKSQIRAAFDKVTVRIRGNSEILINQSIAMSIYRELQLSIQSINGSLVDNLRSEDKMSPSKVQKFVKDILNAAGFRSRRRKRVIGGRSVNVNVFTLSPYAITNAKYFGLETKGLQKYQCSDKIIF